MMAFKVRARVQRGQPAVAAVLLTLIGVMFATAPASAAQRRSRCTRGATVERNRSVRVFSVDHARGRRELYACIDRARRRLHLGSVDPDTPAGIELITLAGTDVAYRSYVC